MNVSVTILTFLAIVNILNFVQTADKYSECKSTFTLGYGYNHIYHISESGTHHDDNGFTFNFWVKAFSDAHILLSPNAAPGNQDPVYEIVIGAGRNTFSDIRRKLRANSKTKIITVDFLSDDEYRGFWIKLTKSGVLQVGKAGDEAPFIFWSDPEPLHIRYFSFCTWGTTVGRWLYSCPNDTQSEEVDVPMKLTTTERLRQDLLQHYDPYSRPILNESDTTYVFFHLTCENIRVDEKKSVVSIGGAVTMHWEDQKLQWTPKDYDNISLLTVLHHEVWQPELILYNSATHGTDLLADTPLLVSSRGFVMWKTRTNMQVRCSLDVSQWPNDQHACELQLGFWAQHEVLHLDLVEEGAKFNKGKPVSSEWDILSLEADPTKLLTPWMNSTTELSDNKALSVRFTIRRKAHAYKTVLAAPLMVFSTLTIMSFWMSPRSSSRILLSCLNLIIMTMIIVALGTILPAQTNQTPQIVLTFSYGMVAVAVSILISVVVIALTRYSHSSALPTMLISLITRKFLQILLCLPPLNKEESTNYEHLQESDQCESSPSGSNSAKRHWEIQQQWILLAKVIDRLTCIIYVIYLAAIMSKHV